MKSYPELVAEFAEKFATEHNLGKQWFGIVMSLPSGREFVQEVAKAAHGVGAYHGLGFDNWWQEFTKEKE